MPLERNENIEKVYAIHRAYIEHEDELIHQRTTSFITIQSFLLATFGFTYQKKYEVAEKLLSQKLTQSDLGSISTEYNIFLLILAVIGAATSLIALRSINAAVTAIRSLKENWLRAADNHPPAYLPGITGGGDLSAHKGGISLAVWGPIFLLSLWILALLALIIILDFHLELR